MYSEQCWDKVFNNKYKRNYYINKESGFSQWGIPRKETENIPAGWEYYYSTINNRPFYYNILKKQTQWEKPEKPEKDDGLPVPFGWKEMRSRNCNNVYYKNLNTHQTQWEYPEKEYTRGGIIEDEYPTLYKKQYTRDSISEDEDEDEEQAYPVKISEKIKDQKKYAVQLRQIKLSKERSTDLYSKTQSEDARNYKKTSSLYKKYPKRQAPYLRKQEIDDKYRNKREQDEQEIYDIEKIRLEIEETQKEIQKQKSRNDELEHKLNDTELKALVDVIKQIQIKQQDNASRIIQAAYNKHKKDKDRKSQEKLDKEFDKEFDKQFDDSDDEFYRKIDTVQDSILRQKDEQQDIDDKYDKYDKKRKQEEQQDIDANQLRKIRQINLSISDKFDKYDKKREPDNASRIIQAAYKHKKDKDRKSQEKLDKEFDKEFDKQFDDSEGAD